MGVLQGKAAVVTGSARGIGRAVAELLAAHGARVLITDLDEETAAEAASAIDGDTAVFGGDLTKDGVPEAHRADAPIDEFGQLDILVNNAGYTWDGMAHKMTDEQFRAMLEIHTVVPFKLLRAAAPYLRDAGKADKEAGREVFRKVVNVTSISGHAGQPRPGELLVGEGGAGRADEDAGARVGPVQGERERGCLRLRRDAPHRRLGQRRRELRQGRRRDPARNPGEDAADGADDHPARPTRDSRGRGRADLLPLLAVVELRPRPGDHRERRADDRHDVVS